MTALPARKIAYLVNRYPKVSHSFIRREIAGLEANGVSVERFSLRGCEEELVDAADLAELQRTRVVLAGGRLRLLRYLLGACVRRPGRLSRALRLAVKIGRHSDRGLARHLAYLAEACVLVEWFAAADIGHVHAHFGTNSAAVALLCRVLGGPPYSFTIHGPEEFDKASVLALADKVARAAFVAVVSSFGRSQLMRWTTSADWPRIEVIHCGLDDDYLAATPTPVPDVSHLVCVGRLCEQKGQLLLLEAIGAVAAEGVPVQLTLVGDGPLRGDIERRIAALHLHDRVRITGWASGDAVRQYLDQARALVLPSFAEGLPVVIMEALALGRPVISTYIAGIPELVEPGVSGWLVPAGSVADLAAAVREVLAAPVAELGRLGAAGAERVGRRHSALIEARKLQALFAASLNSANDNPDDDRSG